MDLHIGTPHIKALLVFWLYFNSLLKLQYSETKMARQCSG